MNLVLALKHVYMLDRRNYKHSPVIRSQKRNLRNRHALSCLPCLDTISRATPVAGFPIIPIHLLKTQILSYPVPSFLHGNL
jgi:hypothetical protein